MNNSKLMHFYKASELGSFQAAARLLRTTASAISYSVNDLECTFKTELFIRSKSGVKLTAFGDELFIFAKRYFLDLEDLFLKAHKKEGRKEKIKIGTFSSMAMYFGPTLLKKLNSDKKLNASIMTNRSHSLFESLLKRDIDIAISVEPPKHSDIKSVELYQDSYSFYKSNNIKIKSLKKNQLENYSLLFMPDAIGVGNKKLSQYVGEFDLNFESEFEFNSLEVIKEYCSKELGIGILPSRVANFYHDEISKITISGTPKFFGKHSFYLSYRLDSDIKSKTIEFILESLLRIVK